MKTEFSSDVVGSSGEKQNPHLLQKPTFRHRVQTNPPLDPVLSYINLSTPFIIFIYDPF